MTRPPVPSKEIVDESANKRRRVVVSV